MTRLFHITCEETNREGERMYSLRDWNHFSGSVSYQVSLASLLPHTCFVTDPVIASIRTGQLEPAHASKPHFNIAKKIPRRKNNWKPESCCPCFSKAQIEEYWVWLKTRHAFTSFRPKTRIDIWHFKTVWITWLSLRKLKICFVKKENSFYVSE